MSRCDDGRPRTADRLNPQRVASQRRNEIKQAVDFGGALRIGTTRGPVARRPVGSGRAATKPPPSVAPGQRNPSRAQAD
jgi:hypothetical protein